MDKKRKRAVELGKDVLIVLLACSALWLLARSQLMGPLNGLWREETPQVSAVQTQSGARADAARPLWMTATLAVGTEVSRYAVQYDEAASDELFQSVAGLLMEALSSVEEPRQITRAQWEAALCTAPGVAFDFQGELPMPVLTYWLAGEDTGLSATVRRLVLTVWQDDVALYYRDEESGFYYRCLSKTASEFHLEEALSALSGNGAVYAFESELYQELDPDTLISGGTPEPAVCNVSNPVSGGQAALEALMTDLGIPVNSSSFYSSGNEQVARGGNDTIRLSDQGVAVYSADEDGGGRFQVPVYKDAADLAESVELCRQLAAATLGSRCGQARLYLMSAREDGAGLEVQFGYCLNGIPVRLESGCAARFVIRKGQITGFELYFRCYTDSGTASVVMPPRQAAAALEALGLTGEELLLSYIDHGGDTAAAVWTAAGNRLSGEG